MIFKILKQVINRLSLVFGFVLILVLFNSFSVLHKFYVSITQIDYVEEQESLQITSRIFIDDLEDLFRELYDKTIVLDVDQESEMVEFYIESYIKEKFNIKINGENVTMNYLGKEYENDIMFCYLEMENIKDINAIEISNKILFDKFDDQKNIIRLKINNKNKSFVLTQDEQIGLLNFN
jgi:hypothetical protein